MKPYQPIACALHDVYEIAIMRRQRLRLQWSDGGQQHDATLQPLDLNTVDAAEWLLVETRHGEQLSIRLDWISRADPL